MSLIHVPGRKHSCDIDWETVPWEMPEHPTIWHPVPPPGVTHRMQPAHRYDPPGTVRQCPECGRYWRAERNRPGIAGVFWRPETRRERRKREKTARDGLRG